MTRTEKYTNELRYIARTEGTAKDININITAKQETKILNEIVIKLTRQIKTDKVIGIDTKLSEKMLELSNKRIEELILRRWVNEQIIRRYKTANNTYN